MKRRIGRERKTRETKGGERRERAASTKREPKCRSRVYVAYTSEIVVVASAAAG